MSSTKEDVLNIVSTGDLTMIVAGKEVTLNSEQVEQLAEHIDSLSEEDVVSKIKVLDIINKVERNGLLRF